MKLTSFLKTKNDTLAQDVTLQLVVEKMYEEGLRYIVLVDKKNYPVGILTERDILFLYDEGQSFQKTKAYDLASKQIVKAHGNRGVEYALNLMVDHQIRRVVVVDDRDNYLGVIEQEEVIFEFEAHAAKSTLKMFELLLNESKALGVDKNTSLQETLDIMKERNFGSILVLENKKAIGILTETDIVRLAKDNIDKQKSVENFMHSPVHKISLKTSLKACVAMMREKKIRRIIVEDSDENGEVIDYIITTKDIINNLQGNYAKFLEAKLFSHRVTFDSLNDIVIEVYDFGSSQVVSWVNKAAKKYLKINIDDSITKFIPQYILDESFEEFKKDASHHVDSIEVQGRFYRYTASSVFMFGTRIIKILLSDFTELYLSNRRLLEQVDVMSDSMHEQEAMQREVINQNAIGIGYLSGKGEILFVNQYVNELLGYKPNELIGKNINDITYIEDIKLSGNQRSKLAIKNKNSELGFEKRYVHKEGYPIWVHVSLSSSKDEQGKVKYIIGFIKDIRNRKEAEQRLKQSAAVFENTKEGIVISDAKLNIQAVNNAFCDILGFDEEEALSLNAIGLRSRYHKGDFYKAIWKSIRKNGYWKGEMWSMRKNGETFPQWLNISTITDENGKTINYVGVISDITTIKQSEQELEFLAHHDPLTKLPNRLLLTARLEQALKQAKRSKSKLAILFLDLDRFKEINDTFGHSYGDEILTTVTKRFQEIMRERDTIARIGGDEFIFLIEEVSAVSDIELILTKILETFKESIYVNEEAFSISASIGVALYPEDGDNIEDLIKNADAAMYQAKDAGRNTYRFYTEEMTQNLFTKMLMKNELERAIRNEEFILHYQPQVSLKTGQVLGVEVLVRWKHPELGLLYPDKFISIAEQTNLIAPLGQLVMLMACKQMKQWLDEGKLKCCKLALNVSAAQIQHNDLYKVTTDILKSTKLSGSYLELELTESYMMEQPEEAIKLFNKLKNHGITLAIDDFGTGYSSLSYLKNLPIDKLKIDRSFVMDLPNDKGDMAITSTIIAMAKSLGLSVIAEGIETKQQHKFLKDNGCYEGQGYYYAKPLSKEDFIEFVKNNS